MAKAKAGANNTVTTVYVDKTSPSSKKRKAKDESASKGDDPNTIVRPLPKNGEEWMEFAERGWLWTPQVTERHPDGTVKRFTI